VSDSYDYWNVVKNILPTLKDEILAHKGCLLVRGDSGDCVKVVTETVFELWKTFGGTINSKGYKVLDSHVKALYGDSITVQRAEEIYRILEENGFAAQNVSLGVGSFSMHCIEETETKRIGAMDIVKTSLKPFTRDTFSMAIKAVYAEFTDENGNVTKMPVYKDPKTDREAGGGNFKKSQKGCCVVLHDGEKYFYNDGYNWDEAAEFPLNHLKTVFKDGKMVVDDDLTTIRQRLNGGKF
jgi:nicotinamide phosphoribosyltransferase